MATTEAGEAKPQRIQFSAKQRLFRGYGPLALLALMLLLMSLLVPSKSPASDGTSGTGFRSNQGGDDDAGSTVRDVAGTEGQAGTEGTEGKPGDGGPAPIDPGTACPDRAEQVPGDPYSPPCIAFSGNNGGATSTGVTPDKIRVSFRVLDERGFQQTLAELAGASLTDTPETVRNTVSAFAEYFSQRFQLYGRQIEIVFYEGVGSNTNELVGKGRDLAEVDAEQAASQGVFADLSSTSEPYANALCSKGVLAFGDPYLSRKWHDERGPCAWSLAVNGTEVAEFAAEFAAKRLAGGNAEFAGGDAKGKPRLIATLAPENPWYQESVQVARQRYEELTGGVSQGPNYQYLLDLGQLSNQASNLIPKMKADGVTTVICGCDPIFPVFLSGVAAREKYFPEFIIAGTALTDADVVGQLWNQQFAQHAFGVSPLQDFVPPTQTIAYQAFKSVRPDAEPAFSVDLIYYQMYMLAIGLQGAGPDLNPDTFQAGMYDYEPKLGPVGLWDFGPGDHTSADDVREIYWDPNAVSSYNGQAGSYIGLDLNGDGLDDRYRRNELPSGRFPKPS
ncbi:MAG: ABC transporter substrate-binding protein [Actinomycetota bacterium]